MKTETLTSRQRLLTALDHRNPDRVPIDLGGNQTSIHKFAYQALIDHLGIEDALDIMDPVQQLARPCEAVLQRFHVDTRYVAAGPASASRRPTSARDPAKAVVGSFDEEQVLFASRHEIEDSLAPIGALSSPWRSVVRPRDDQQRPVDCRVSIFAHSGIRPGWANREKSAWPTILE